MDYLVGFAFLLLIRGQYCLNCAVSDDQRPPVTSLKDRMIQAVTAVGALPNPSALLALRLAQDHDLSTEQKLLKELSQDAINRVKSGQDFSSGLVALYVLAHQASCSDPRKVTAQGRELDLMDLLERKFEKELDSINISGNPLTSYYQLSLCVLALCQNQDKSSVSQASAMFIPDDKKYQLAGHFSVDTAAVAVLAQICMQNSNNALPPEVNRTLTDNITWLLRKMLEQKSSDGIIGNMYSTGLAMQALLASSSYLTPANWSCSQTLSRVLEEVPKGTFNNPMAAAQLLASLEGKTYLDVSTVSCPKDQETYTRGPPQIISATTQHPSQHFITVFYTVTDSVYNTFSDPTIISVPEGSVFFKVMQAAEEKDPKKFRFTFEQTTWGPYITSVQGLRADNAKRTYWQLLSCKIPLEQGAGDYVVTDGESLLVKFTTY